MPFIVFSLYDVDKDVLLINASTIVVKDILRKESVMGVRITVMVIGGLSLALALLGRGDIMSLLTGAYSIYTPGVIFPLMIAVYAYSGSGVRRGVWLAAVIVGGLFGLAGTYFGDVLAAVGVPEVILQYLTLIGMGLSLVISLFSVKKKEA